LPLSMQASYSPPRRWRDHPYPEAWVFAGHGGSMLCKPREDGYRGVSLEEAIISCCGKVPPTSDIEQMPLDWEIVEYTIGDEARDMSEKQVDNIVKGLVPWYDGSVESVKGGLNLTTDLENAKGYASEKGAVLGIQVLDQTAEFSDDYLYARRADDAKVVKIYYQDKEYTPEQFLREFRASCSMKPLDISRKVHKR